MLPFPNRFIVAALVCVSSARAAVAQPPANLKLDPGTKFQLVNARAIWVDYRGRKALKLAPLEGHEQDTDQELMAVLTGSDFRDGVIDVDVSGARRAGYSTVEDVSGFKGIVGMTFRVRGDSAERFYIRPENSRLNNQLFRNRSTQYESSPDYPWQRLRQESPDVYESYADIESGAWTHLRIEVTGARARLYVNGATQPSLVVNDLRHGASHGAIALWSRISTEAYFSNLRVSARSPSLTQTAAPRAAARASADRGALPAFSSVVNARPELVTYRGVRAVKLVPTPEAAHTDGAMLAIVDRAEFKDGAIDVDVAGAPRADAPATSRGFIGISFRTGERGAWSEVFYLRPTNGRADDQLRRNHSAQYVSDPAFPWPKLRSESPGVYESYVDLEPGAWTHMRIEVSGATARLFVNHAPQPTLVVNDLKHGDGPGQIALWAHVETDAYFGPVVATSGAESTFRGGPDHVGIYSSSTPTLQSALWRFKTAGRVISSPTVDGDAVYVGATDGALYSLNRSDGSLRWKFETQGAVNSSPAIAGGVVFAGSVDGRVYAVDASTGKQKWVFKTHGERRFTAPGIHGATPHNEIMADPFDMFLSSPVVAGGTVYIGSGDHNVYALDAQTGALQWTFATGDVVHASPAVTDGTVFIGSWDRNLYALDATSGAERWRYQTGNDTTIHNQIGIASSAAVAGGIVFFGCRDGHFYAVDEKTGALKWSHDNHGGWVIASPAVKDNVVYFPTADGTRFKALDATTGAVKYSIEQKAISFSSPAIVNDEVIFGSSDGWLHALALGDGTTRAEFQSEGSKANASKYIDAKGHMISQNLYPDFTLDGMIIGVHNMFTLGSFLSSPAVAGGVVYIGSTDGNVYAIR